MKNISGLFLGLLLLGLLGSCNNSGKSSNETDIVEFTSNMIANQTDDGDEPQDINNIKFDNLEDDDAEPTDNMPTPGDNQ